MKQFYLILLITILSFPSKKLYSELTVIADSVGLSDNSKLNLGSNFLIRDLDCFDADNCILTGNYHNIGACLIKTSDGGETWSNFFVDDFNLSFGKDTTKKDKDYVIHNNTFINKNSVIAADAVARKFFKSKDNGQTWDTIPGSIIDTLVFIKDIKMFNNHFGYIVTGNYFSSPGYDYAVYITEDGCRSWSRINFDMNFVDHEKFWPVFIDGKVINNKVYALYFLGYKKKHLRYENIIVTYDLISNEQNLINIPLYTNDFYFLNENEGIAVGNMYEPIKFNMDTALIHKTYDGGKTWELVYKGNEKFKEAENIYFFSQNMIVVNGKGNLLLVSQDRGINWYNISDTNKNAEYVAPVTIASENTIYFFKNDNFYKWVDGETSVVELPNINDFKIYPNPVQDYLRINPPQSPFGKGGSELASREITEIVIYNVLGEKVMTLIPTFSQREKELRINVSQLPTGMYFIKIGDKIEKFVKE